MEEGLAFTTSSLVDTSAPPDYAEAGDLLAPNTPQCREGSLSYDGIWLAGCDEEADEANYLNREGKRRHEEFYNAGYRDSVAAGRYDAAQDGFNQGFKDSVMFGFRWGIVRGVTSGLAHIPNKLKLKLVASEENSRGFQQLFEAVDSGGTYDALNIFYDMIKQAQEVSPEKGKTVESASCVTHSSGSQHSEVYN